MSSKGQIGLVGEYENEYTFVYNLKLGYHVL